MPKAQTAREKERKKKPISLNRCSIDRWHSDSEASDGFGDSDDITDNTK